MTSAMESGAISAGAIQLLPPPRPGVCRLCAVDHSSLEPHSAVSLYYQYRFRLMHGRWPTWADAVAHCSDAMAHAWRQELEHRGKWTEPTAGSPIAEPYAKQPQPPAPNP